jgi:Spy/CpxP family protein refolding chaperone
MRHFAVRLLPLLSATAAAMMAQTPTVRTMTSFGTGVVLPSFLPAAPPPMDAAAYWSAYLGLDAAQQATVKSILSDQQNSIDSLKANLEQAHIALGAAANAASADPQIDNLAANLGAVYTQAVAAQAKAYAKFYALLTPAQKQKLDSLTAGGGGAITVVSSGGSSAASANQ